MRRLSTCLAVVVSAAALTLVVTTAGAEAPPASEQVTEVIETNTLAEEKPACVATVAQHRTYARAVYKRTRISTKARHKLAMMRKCSKSSVALRRMHKTEKKLSAQRRMRLTMHCGTPTCNRNLIYYMVSQRRGAAEANCAVALSGRESGWRHTVYNYGGSGAYGLGQALPGSKMAAYGADWRTNPATQIRWFIDYSVGRYGSMCGADSFQRRNNWY